MSTSGRDESIAGCVLGMAVGDAIGLPLEGLSPARARKLFGEIDNNFGMRLCFGRGFVSDDTEHALLTLQAFSAADNDPEKFEKELARRLKSWFLKLPPGTGLATAKSCFKLLLGIPPQRSGTFSAGNGPVMRAPILGTLCSSEESLRRFIKVSTRITHTDPKAELGAYVIGLAAHYAAKNPRIVPREFVVYLRSNLSPSENFADAAELLSLIECALHSVEKHESTPHLAQSLGLSHGVSGYTFHTVPVVVHAWLSNQDDMRSAILECLRCGGDSDSTAAITGGIIGIQTGEKGVPQDWLAALCEWPHGVAWMRTLVNSSLGTSRSALCMSDLLVMPRNLVLLLIVLLHEFRRILPPY